ncbi:MAG TPA: peptide-methionine (R)-S-oxide reductase MsrB [Sphingomicrobium sp.]|nr:peptide-methionine (R)-S-oxide reductase MsrB [Sphingomicrobium sp.]
MTSMQFNRRGLIGAATLTAIGVAIAAHSTTAAAKYQVIKTPAEWRKQLGAQRYAILRQQGTERPFSSPFNKEKRRGIYTCAGCDLPVFPSTAKYDSGTGWPSFWREFPGNVAYKRDTSLFMDRTEEHCRRCGGHLGHVFDDGPKPTGKRHCINGLSLKFRPA